MSSKVSFEHLCIQQYNGYCFDEGALYQPENPENFEEVIIKLSSKIETSIFLIESHKGRLEEFTLIAIPLPSIDNGCNKAAKFMQIGERSLCVEEMWKSMHTTGWDSLQVLSVIDDLSVPDNGSRINSLQTFTTCLLESLKAYFLFQKPKLSYSWSELFDSAQNIKSEFGLALVWKNKPQPIVTAPEPQTKRSYSRVTTPITKRMRVEKTLPERFVHSPFQRELVVEEESESDEETEITFKNYVPTARTPSPVRKVSPVRPPSPVRQPVSVRSTRARGRGRYAVADIVETPDVEESMEVDMPSNSTFNDVTLGFEMSTATPSRKSGVRKSIVPDWPENEKSLILALFDNLNPKLSEQKRIALTCRYVVIQYEKELTSKIFYNWIQKKGRNTVRTIESFQLNEDEQKKEMIDFFKSLNPSQPENTRIAFTLKYFQAQYNVNLPSKQLYSWLNDKPVKKGRKSMR